jgi:hypothetical protein
MVPDPEWEECIKALITFKPLGEMIQQNPGLVQELIPVGS